MNANQKTYAGWAAALMAVAVILGAIGAHALQTVLNAAQLESFLTGVRYHAWHALGLLLIQVIPENSVSDKTRLWSSRLMIGGLFCFSFSIYFLNLRGLLGMEFLASILGPITPVGGLLLIMAWAILAIGLFRR